MKKLLLFTVIILLGLGIKTPSPVIAEDKEIELNIMFDKYEFDMWTGEQIFITTCPVIPSRMGVR